MLTQEGCAQRRERLQHWMRERGWDTFVTGSRFSAYYLGGKLVPPDAPVYFVLFRDGETLTEVPETYSAHRAITAPYHEGFEAIRPGLRGTVAVERSGTPAFLTGDADASDTILALRKSKHPDEITEIREALRFCAIAYDAAREAIAPGLTEIDVFNAMHSAVTRAAGTVIEFRGDFACGERGIKEGGPPTPRQLLPGDLYILDIFPAPALYFGDTCRTLAVTPPAARQIHAWKLVKEAVALAESMVRPGIRASAVHNAVKEYLDADPLTGRSFWHHTGHGIGHRGHEAPRLIAESSDRIEEGDVITIEPGVYTSALQGGIRLEDNYLVTRTGLERLFHYPDALWPGVSA
ncbi:MAG: aminopeptidase P family protein [Acidobacteria bacterium]|nr:aminopeptidase P family protein [Acidobacteriota bacterium]